MDHDVRAVANVFYKLARADGVQIIKMDMHRLCGLADRLCRQVLNEPLVADPCYDGIFPALTRAFGRWRDGVIKGREETRTRPIKEEAPAWKVIRGAWMQFDYEQRHGTAASDATARQAGT